MEMAVSQFCVVSNFGNDVRKKIGSAYLGSIVELRANRGGKCRWKGDEGADVLIRVLNTHAERPVIVGVIGNAELRCAGESQANLEILVLVVGSCLIGGYRAYPSAVG